MAGARRDGQRLDASGAGTGDDGRGVGLQLGGTWTEGTPATDDVLVDGRVR